MDSTVVRWVASQSTNPALRALIKEAEKDQQSRPSTPILDQPHWSGSSSWHASHRATPPVPSGHLDSARPRSSSNAISLSTPSSSNSTQEKMTFMELLKDVTRQVDENAQKKQRLAARAREKDRARSLARRGTDTRHLSARPLVKTSSTSAISSVAPSTLDATQHCHRGRPLSKTASLGASRVDLVSGKFTPNSLPSLHLNCNPKHVPAHTSSTPASGQESPVPTSQDEDSPMEDVLDLTEPDIEWDRRKSYTTSPADTSFMQVDYDDLDGDTAMDVSFIQPLPRTRIVRASKPKPQPTTASHSSAPTTQRPRTGPPPLGMRRAPLPQPSQYCATQSAKTSIVPRFKPPLLSNTGGSSNKETKPAATTGSRHPLITKTQAAGLVPESQDADSSFDVSLDIDPETIVEAMKPYDRI